MRKLLVTKSILHAKFCLQINARVCLSNSRWILFCNNNVVVVVGCDATIHYFSGFVKVMKHMPYQSFLWIERSIPKVQILLRCLTKKKRLKNGDSMQIFNLFDSKWWIKPLSPAASKDITTITIPYAISYYFVFFRQNVLILFTNSLFRNKRFMLDEMSQWNASKFAIFYTYENWKLLFLFFVSYYFIFSLMNALVYVDIDQGIH